MIAREVGAWSRRLTARVLVARALDLHVVGLQHIPKDGPAILAARHFHHLFDAAAILASVPREVHVLVALDWLDSSAASRALRGLIRAARWPGVWRTGRSWRFNRQGYRLSLELLREGRLLLIFPEGYPSLDPRGSRKSSPNVFLPFDPGFVALAERAQVRVPVVPVGLWYAPRRSGGWTVWLRFGPPITCAPALPGSRRTRLTSIEAAVRQLSAPP